MSKPIVGQQVRYRGQYAGIVSRVEGNLCWLKNTVPPSTDDAPFIWRLRDGENVLHDWPTKEGDVPYVG